MFFFEAAFDSVHKLEPIITNKCRKLTIYTANFSKSHNESVDKLLKKDHFFATTSFSHVFNFSFSIANKIKKFQ